MRAHNWLTLSIMKLVLLLGSDLDSIELEALVWPFQTIPRSFGNLFWDAGRLHNGPLPSILFPHVLAIFSRIIEVRDYSRTIEFFEFLIFRQIARNRRFLSRMSIYQPRWKSVNRGNTIISHTYYYHFAYFEVTPQTTYLVSFIYKHILGMYFNNVVSLWWC